MDVRTAIIGSGVAGLGAAWALRDDRDVLVLEEQPHVGGNALTTVVDGVAVDMGFIVCNDRTYPRFLSLLDALGVALAESDMSLSVQPSVADGDSDGHRGARPAYAGSLPGLLGGGRWRRRRSWQRLAGIVTLGPRARRLAASGVTVGEAKAALGEVVVDDYVLPMASAIWSAPREDAAAMPLRSLVAFFDQHGLFDLAARPTWRTVQGGSARYVEALVERLAGRVRTEAPVTAMARTPRGWRLTVGDSEQVTAARVVLATPADAALALLGDAATPVQRDVLGRFTFSDNLAVLHSDESVMPADRSLWSSWNVVAGPRVAVTYWMNRLQPLDADRDLFVTLNPTTPLRDVHRVHTFRHPVLDGRAAAGQRALHRIQGDGDVWVCGAWTGYGFHEDGLESGLVVGAAVGGRPSPPAGPDRPAARVMGT